MRAAASGPMGHPPSLVQRLRDMAVALSLPKQQSDGGAVSAQLQEVEDAVERLRRDID